MSNKRKRNAIHSGIGDNDDLFVKRPKEEDVTETFKYATRLRGKKQHETMIYPELPFQYGISYTGQTLETYNEKEYEFGVHAHPEKTIGYRIEETKELPVKRMWEAQACFEAQVWRMNMKYALNWKGKKTVQARNEVDYAVSWKAAVVSKAISDARDLFTSANGTFIGYGDETTWKKHSTGYVYDYSNIGRFSGIIAKNYSNLINYEAEFDFKTVLASNDQHVGGNDDDIVGLIFKAKDNRNFYMMLWERHARVKGSWRAPNNLENFNMLSSGEQAWEDRITADGCKSSSSMSDSAWADYQANKGWKGMHRRIYKVTNGVMNRVNATDLGDGKGWDLNELHSMKVVSIGTNVQLLVKDNGVWKKVFDLDTAWDEGSFGMVNVSQSVQFHRIEIKEKHILTGRIPETGWSTMEQASKSLGTGYNYCITQAKQKANALKATIPTVDANAIDFISISGSLKTPSEGSITSPIGEQTNITVTAGTHAEQQVVSGRVPATGWYEFDGIGDYTHATNARDFIKSKSTVAAQADIVVESVTGEVWNDPQYPVPTGYVAVSSVTGPIVVHNNNPTDAGQIYNKCYIRCGIVEVTPDHRNYSTGLLVFSDIATIFKEDYNEFFNRIDYINKKAEYKLLKPVKKDSPKPPPIEESEGGCVIEEPTSPEEDPIDQCLNDFDFDGKKLIMWSCEFPIEITTKLFEDNVYAYRGWTTFNPLAKFTPNKWTWYKLIPIEATLDLRFDEVKWAGRDGYDKAPVGTKVIARTKEWYKAIFPADVINKGIVNSEGNIKSTIPPAPEHYYLPDTDIANVQNRMPDKYDVVHFLLDAWSNHSDVSMWFESNATLTTATVDRRPESLAQEGRAGMPIVLTSNDNDKIVIHCKPDPRHLPWTSGKYIGYGKVNGKRPYWSKELGKADMVNVPTDVVFFPSNLIKETLSDPIIDVYDKEFPNYPRISYRLHDNKKLVDFYSDNQEMYVWHTDWYTKWKENTTSIQVNLKEEKVMIEKLDLNPAIISDDYQPDKISIEEIEVVSDNPFVKTYVGRHNLPEYANIMAHQKVDISNFVGEWIQWDEVAASPGVWIGPPATTEVTDTVNHGGRSAWYNPTHTSFEDYEFSFKVQVRNDADDDMYGCVFRFNPMTKNFYSFEMDAFRSKGSGGIGRVQGMVLLRNMYDPILKKWTAVRLGHLPEGWTWNVNEINDIRVKVEDNRIQVWKNNTLKFDVVDSQPLLNGAWGPMTESQAKTFFWDFSFIRTAKLECELKAQVKKARPLPWNPMIHNGYYYHEDREHYLYAEKVVHKKTPNAFHEFTISPRPQQGSAIIVRDNQGNHLRKVTFYDDNWNLTLENKEEFNGNGYAKYYLNYKGIDKATLKVKLNGVTLLNHDFIFHEEESSIEFMNEIQFEDTIEVRYILLYSYYVDMNADMVDGFVNQDMARIKLHSNYTVTKMINMEILYEAAKETPFYRATEVVFNPLLNHNHTGFLYITENAEQNVKDLMVNLSDDTLSNSGLEKVLLTVRVLDQYNNPCPNKLVKILRDGILIGEEYSTNDAGEVYLYDTPVPTEELISMYQVSCSHVTKEVLLNYYVDNEPERYYLDILAEKLSVMAKVNDVSTILVTLRDKDWNPVGAGKTVKVEYRDTYGDIRTENLITNANGQVFIQVSGQTEQHGSMMVKVAYDMGFEDTANYVHLKVIGG